MTTSDNFLLNRRKDPRFCFLHNSNRRKIIDGNSRRQSTYPDVSSLGNNLFSGASSYDQSRGPRTLPGIRGIPYGKFCVGESSQVFNPASGAALSGTDLTDSTGLIQVNSRKGHTQQYQSNKKKMNIDSAPLVKNSEINATPVSRLSKQKEQITHPTIPESKQLTQKRTTPPLKDPAGFDKKSAVRGIRTSMHFLKKIQPLQNPPDLVVNCGTSTILASKPVIQKKETAQPLKDPAGVVKNIGTRRILASKHVMQKREISQPPKDLAGEVKNIGTSRLPASMHTMQKKKTTQSPKYSEVWVKKSETTSRIPEKKGKNQPSKGSAGLVGKSGTGRTLLSKLVTHKTEIIPAKPRQEQHIFENHIAWEGFDQCIVPLEKSCLLCNGDLANEPEYDPDIERLDPAENAVLSCGHVFHSLCLLFCTSEKSRDPPCMICGNVFS